MKEKLSLVFVNSVGKNYEDEYIYEFIFSEELEGIDGIEWDSFPANGNPQSPHKKFIKKVGTLISELKLDVLQNSESFAMWDAVDGVIALAWENLDDYETYPENRLCFKFGENIISVEEKLYNRETMLNYEKNAYKRKTVED